MKKIRLVSWLALTIVLFVLIAIFSPQQLPVTIYKLSLVSIAVVLGYHLDRALFPYASPGSYLVLNWKSIKSEAVTANKKDAEYPVLDGYELIFAAVLLRRAIVVTAVILGVTLGL